MGKRCTKCKTEKLYSDFGKEKSREDGLSPVCKDCRKIYYIKNREHILERGRKWAEKNQDKIKQQQAKWREDYAQSEKLREETKQRVYDWREKKFGKAKREREEKRLKKIKEKVDRQKQKYYRAKYLTPFKKFYRTYLWSCFKKEKFIYNCEFIDVLGCDFETLKSYIEKQFVKGMTWENKGEWETDHIIPLGKAQTLEEVKVLCHYTNIQPLWKNDNKSKFDSIPLVCNLHYRNETIFT